MGWLNEITPPCLCFIRSYSDWIRPQILLLLKLRWIEMRLNRGGVVFLNGITRDTLSCLFSDEFILFFWSTLSYVSNENVWKRVRTGLSGLTLRVSGFSKMSETHTTKTLGGFFPTSVSG